MMDTNYFTVLVKAHIEKFNGRAPSQEQWDIFATLVKNVPTERLSQ